MAHIIDEGELQTYLCEAPRFTSSYPLLRPKTGYTCPSCGLNTWTKPTMSLVCGDCQAPMHSEVDYFVQSLAG
jgi:hypothetical protein